MRWLPPSDEWGCSLACVLRHQPSFFHPLFVRGARVRPELLPKQGVPTAGCAAVYCELS